MENGQLHPVQEAFIEEQADCGYCTSGMIIANCPSHQVHHPMNVIMTRTAICAVVVA
jgi:aerobic-type carbon monoxide dehydrogenase small subunit (CoxS/CutS family)